MDEEVGAKATPVTRLRRRLSVEPEDSPLPTTPSTPTKKRSTRLATKPQLDLIDEIATDNVPKRSTRKAAVKDAETDAGTRTPVTPTRRSTRIRSNTSILSETITQSIESPRAKRALRRTSQHGSDTEATVVVTPGMQTRRTRKDSTTSVDKQAATENVVTTAISNIINETIIESEKEFTETSTENDTSSSTTRRSPRLNQKISKAAAKNGNEINDLHNTLNTSKQDIHKPTQTVTNVKESQNKIDCASLKVIQNKNEKISSLHKDYSTDAKHNELNSTSNKETERNRTISQSTDSEHAKEKSFSSSISGSDVVLANDLNTCPKNVEPDMMPANKSINKSKSLFLSTCAENKENVDCHLLLTQFEINKSDTVKLFDISPDNQNVMVLMEDSDSGCCNHPTTDIQKEDGDQCAPISRPHESPDKFSQGAEPMDIDESVLANVTLDDFSDKSTDSKDVEEFEIPDRKRKTSVSEKSMLLEDSTNRSKKKSSVSIPVELKNNSINKSKTNTSFQEKNSEPKIVQSKKSFSLVGDETDRNKSRKSLASLNADNEQKLDQIVEKSQRKSSISLNVSEANQSKDESIKSINKSQRKSSVSNYDENYAKLNESANKSKRKSSVSIPVELKNDSINKSKTNTSFQEKNSEPKIGQSKKSISLAGDETDRNKSRKSLASLNADNEQKLDQIVEKSQRKSSISLNVSEANQSKDESIQSINKSLRKSSVSNYDENDARLNESANKSKRKSSVSIPLESNNESINKSKTDTPFQEKNSDSKIVHSKNSDETDRNKSRKSLALLNADNEQKFNQIVEKSKRKSSISLNVSGANQSKDESMKSINNSQRKSSVSNNDDNNAKLNESPKKSERKSSISLNVSNGKNETTKKLSISTSNENCEKLDENDSKISTKLKRNSLSETELLEKSGNENKSTLVISPLKDVSNASMSSNVTTNELTKSMNGPEIKGINKKNLSMNCLTSTPIQQKPVHKITMQINTTFISPTINQSESLERTPKLNISNKNTSDSDSCQDEKYNIKPTKKKYSASKKNTVASSSLDSSDNESKTDSRIRSKKFIKKSPAITQPAHDSSESSDEEINIMKTPKKNNDNDSNIGVKNDKSHVDSSDDSDIVSKNKSEMLDDEALEAGDDYQSGDSRNEEEKRYEAENEIVAKSETLDSEEDLSNDSDYEKDSFVASSDAEDSEMLSGTGDDLSMSDNELDMSAKSKKKFNDRKIKQQKRASREMYEARHKNDKSSNSTAENSKSAKTKMSKRQRLESDTEEPKKNKRLRIDSSQDKTNEETIGSENQTMNNISMSKVDIDEFIGYKKYKSKRLSESLCEDETMNENEININRVAEESIGFGNKKKKSKRLSESMCEDITKNEKEITLNQSAVEKNDPLSAAIKQEPKTPRKFDMSTVAINEDVEEIQVDANASIINPNETTDPLQVTMAADNDDTNTSSSDEGEFVQNYDSVLSNLSKHTKIIETMDASLDLNKKTKKSKDPVIDQLNLTQTKPSKKNKKDRTLFKSPVKDITKDADSSDSIDMKLLFPEDSNDSVIHASQFKPEEFTDFIPLKRTAAKTNIRENMDKSISLNESALNASKKKDKSRNLSQCAPEEQLTKFVEANEQEDTNIQIFIDTTGTYQESDKLQSKSSQKKKNKNKSLNESTANTGEIDCTDGVTKTPIETSFASEKKNKNKEISFVGDDHSDNKFTKLPNSISEFEETHIVNTGNTVVQETPGNDSIKSDKKKKKKKKVDVSQIIEPIEAVPELNTSATKKSKKSLSDISEPVHSTDDVTKTPIDTSFASEKKKNKNKSLNKEISFVEDDHSDNKFTKLPNSISEFEETHIVNTGNTVVQETPGNDSIKSDKKKKKKKVDVSQIIEPIEAVPELNTNATKKSKKSLSDISEPVHSTETEVIPADTSMTNEKKKKKNKKNKNLEVSQILMDNAEEDSDEAPIEISFKSTKKSDTTVEAQMIGANGEGSTNRKRKHLDDECIAAYDVEQGNGDGNPKKSKKNLNPKQQDNVAQEEIVHKPRKRKNRHDDSQQKISKISKQNLFDEVHVPTLPESVLGQLTDKPTREERNQRNKTIKKKAAKAISTAPFVVEEVPKRKNKPSNYLEQSVYLNESPEKEKHIKLKQKNPKVLPFTPTALTSESGYTSKYNINVLPNDTQFVAQSSNVQNFKESFLGNQRIKNMGSLERCKIQRSRKLSKF